MNLVLDIGSSAEFWRQRYPEDRSPAVPPPLPPEECVFRKRDVISLLPNWVDADFLAPTNGVFHVLSLEHQKSKQLQSIAFHSWEGPIPAGSFYELKSGVFVESPAFMFLHAATILDLAQLIAFGDELCGYYSFDARERRGFRKRSKPIASKEQLHHLLQQAAGCKGRKQAMRALPFVVEKSASPMETLDEMTMCLPYRHGGYGLYPPCMNHEVPLTPEAARIAKRDRCYLDMGYPDSLLDVEHHGKLDHSSDADKDSDFARVNALKEMEFEVVELSIDQVEDLFAYESIIKRIARILGKRLQKANLGPLPERIALRKDLFAWNRSNGKLRT